MSKKQTGCSVDGCTGKHLSKGFCGKHYWRNHRHGSPEANPSRDGEPLAWIVANMAHEGDDCLRWPFGYGSHGYGSVLYNGSIMGAHRAMCFVAHGEPPTEGHQAAHSCGRGHEGCVNPKHLRWATAAENNRDRVDHRHVTGRIGGMKVTDEQCMEMLRLRGTMQQVQIARMFGVSEAAVSRLFRGSRRIGIAKTGEAA